MPATPMARSATVTMAALLLRMKANCFIIAPPCRTLHPPARDFQAHGLAHVNESAAAGSAAADHLCRGRGRHFFGSGSILSTGCCVPLHLALPPAVRAADQGVRPPAERAAANGAGSGRQRMRGAVSEAPLLVVTG